MAKHLNMMKEQPRETTITRDVMMALTRDKHLGPLMVATKGGKWESNLG